jgi:hypothetical protein
VVASGLVAFWPKEPTYEGKPLSYWLDRLPRTLSDGKLFHDSFSIADKTDKSAFSATESQAQSAVNQLGPCCLPMLAEHLQAKDTGITRMKQHITIWWSLHRWKPHVAKPQILLTPESRRRQAVTAIIQLGDTAKPILPQLRALAVTDPDPGVRASALQVVQHLSPSDYAQIGGQTNANASGAVAASTK